MERAALLALVWLSAVNCRAGLLAVGPILPRIIEDVGLSYTLAGSLFSLPVLMMGLLAIPGGLLVDRVGAGRTLGWGLALLGAASALRAEGSVATLFAGTALVGATIGTIQPGLPRVVRERFADRVGLGTAVYSLGFTAGTLLAVTLTPLWLVRAAGGWQATLVVWGALSALTALGWIPLRGSGARGRAALDRSAFGAVLRDGLLWRIALLQAMNSAVFYGANAWLTAYYESLGWSRGPAALPLAVLTAVGVAAGFAAPVLSDRARRRRPILVWTCVAAVVGMAGYLVAPHGTAWASSALFGLGLFASFTVNLALPVDVAPPDRVGAAAGVVFSVGHAGGLLGPQLGGYLRDLTGRYEAGIAVMLVMTVVMTAFALAIPETYGGVKREGRL